MPFPEKFVTEAPNPQAVVDLYAHQWISNLPIPGVVSGTAQLFYDDRIEWLIEKLGSVSGLSTLELGPLEGGHSWMLEQAGISNCLSIEANTNAFMRCLLVKELLQMTKTRFILGDFVEYLRNSDESFDLTIACGVLYHMISPMELLYQLGQKTNNLLLWTHYYDEAAIQNNGHISGEKFSAHAEASFHDVEYRLHRYEYLDALALEAFCGGTAPHSHWIEKSHLFDALQQFGFSQVDVMQDDPTHPNGPCITLLARTRIEA